MSYLCVHATLIYIYGCGRDQLFRVDIVIVTVDIVIVTVMLTVILMLMVMVMVRFNTTRLLPQRRVPLTLDLCMCTGCSSNT